MPRPLSIIRHKQHPEQRRQVIIHCSDAESIYATEARLGAYGVTRIPTAIPRSEIAELELAGERSQNLGLYTGLGFLLAGLTFGHISSRAAGKPGAYEVPGTVFGGVLGLAIGLPHFIGGTRMKSVVRRKAQWTEAGKNEVRRNNCSPEQAGKKNTASPQPK